MDRGYSVASAVVSAQDGPAAFFLVSSLLTGPQRKVLRVLQKDFTVEMFPCLCSREHSSVTAEDVELQNSAG